jgi:hypothetical protein
MLPNEFSIQSAGYALQNFNMTQEAGIPIGME